MLHQLCGHDSRGMREWLFTFPFPPIPMQSIPIPFHSHSHFCDYSHCHPIPVDLFPFSFLCGGPKHYAFTSNFCKKNKSAENCNFRVLRYSFMFWFTVYSFCTLLCKKSRLLLLYSTTIFLSRWWESIPMGIGVIPIPILIDSNSHCLFNSCPIPMGFPFSLGFPFRCTSLHDSGWSRDTSANGSVGM